MSYYDKHEINNIGKAEWECAICGKEYIKYSNAYNCCRKHSLVVNTAESSQNKEEGNEK